MCNCQTKRTIVALFLYPEIPHVGFRFGLGDRIFVCLRDCAIPHNRRFYRTICLLKPAQFSFFPAPCQKACYYLTNLDLKSTFLIFASSEKSTSLPLHVKMNQHFNLFPPEINIFFGCFFEKSTSLLPRINQQF